MEESTKPRQCRPPKTDPSMITRPLDLATQLRRTPRSFDWAFYVNLGLIALFFVLFGSRFVLSPALAVDGKNVQLPRTPIGSASFVPSTLRVSVKANGQIFVDPNGLVTYEQLKTWMVQQSKLSPGASLLLLSDAGVTMDRIAQISDAAFQAGLAFNLAVEPAKDGAGE